MGWWRGDSVRFEPNPLEFAKQNNNGLTEILEYLSGNKQ